jgi:putative transcriptional regulator
MTQDYTLVGEALKEKPFQYKGCGLDDVYLLNGYDIHETRNGQAVTIKNMEGLHRAIGRYLVQHKKLMNGKELRFLRVQMDLTQSELGKLLGYSDQQVARWEKGRCSIPTPANKILRFLFQEHLGNKNISIRDFLELIDSLDERLSDKQAFEKSDKGWRAAA